MKNLPKYLLASLLAGCGLAAIAQSAAPAGPGRAGPELHAHGDPTMDPARRQELRQLRMERRLAALKLKLQISGAQEAAWNAWVSAMKPPAQPQRLDRAELERLTTPERIDRLRVVRTARTAEMDRRGDATKAFYGALSADQRKVFDGESLRMLGRGGPRGHHGHRQG